jgi:drug/metabolite transporter (DMT)-like permease
VVRRDRTSVEQRPAPMKQQMRTMLLAAQSQALSGLAAGILAITLFALTPTTTRTLVGQFSGLDIGLIRTVGGGAFAIPLIIGFRIRAPDGRREWQLILLFSLGCFALFPSLFSIGTQKTSATHASLIMASMPLTMSAIGFLLNKRAPPLAWFAGAALALAGELVLISIADRGASPQSVITGDLLVLVSCIAFCVGAVAGSRLTARIGPWRPTFWAIAIAGAALFPLALAKNQSVLAFNISPTICAALIHIVVGANILACVAWSFALARGGIARVASLQFAQPALAMFFAAALLGESIGVGLLVCGMAILAGVIIAWRST